jgi:phosphatidate cytidylyltransferase
VQQRLISAAVLVPVVVIVFLVGAPWLTLFIAALAAFAAYETAQLVRRAGLPTSLWFPVVFAPVAVLVMALSVEPGFELHFALVAPGIATLFVIAAMLAVRQPTAADAFKAWIGTVFAAGYPALLAFLAAFVGVDAKFPDATVLGQRFDTGRLLLLVLVLTVWSLDSFALLAGKFHGRGRFMNHISPNKTWSGAIGGSIAAVVVCALLMGLIGMSVIGGALLGVVIAVTAQTGDLAESMLKRAAGAKDSGTLIPGHGGFLDRLDSFLFAGPAMYTSLVVVAGVYATSLL